MPNKLIWMAPFGKWISKFLDIVMLEFLKDSMKNLLLEFLSLFVLIPAPQKVLLSTLPRLEIVQCWILSLDPSRESLMSNTFSAVLGRKNT